MATKTRMAAILAIAAALLAVGVSPVAHAEVVYWQFDENGTNPNDALGGVDLIRQTSGRSALYATIANPDPGLPTTKKFDDGSNPALNLHSAYKPVFRRGSSSSGTVYFRMIDRSWTLEGYFRRNPSDPDEGPLDDPNDPNDGWGEIIANTRNLSLNWDDGWTLRMDNNGSLMFRAEDGNNAVEHTSTGTYADGLWHHFAVTWDHDDGALGAMQLYVDGLLEDSGPGVGTGVDGSTVYFTIGHRNLSNGAQNRFMGRLDEFRWTYDEVLEPWQFLNGTGVPPTSGTVPEPAALGLIGLALIGLRRRRA